MWKFWVSREERREMDRKRRMEEARRLMRKVPSAIENALLYGPKSGGGGGGDVYMKWTKEGRPKLEALLEEYGSAKHFDESLFGRYWWD